jgi:hypothetical protein
MKAVEDWPELSPSKDRRTSAALDADNNDNDWELLEESQEIPISTSFENDAVRVDGAGSDARHTIAANQRILKHCQSSPDLRHYVFDETDEYGPASDEDVPGQPMGDTASLASSSVVWVAGPPSVMSLQSNSKLSFRDAILRRAPAAEVDAPEDPESEGGMQGRGGSLAQQGPRIRKTRKPKYVVQPIRRCAKSTGDLQSLARIVEDGPDHAQDSTIVLGETDAQEFYSRKAQGKIARINGLKTRPDEAKRLQMAMAKKDQQRQQRGPAGKG